MTFEDTFGFVRVVCSKTMRGDLEMNVAGTLSLLGNNAGKLGDFRFACTGGSVTALNDLVNNPVRLSWTRVETQPAGNERSEGIAVPIDVRVIVGGDDCLYEMLFTLRGTANGNRIYRTFELMITRVLRVETRAGICPEAVRLVGTLTLTRPAAGIRIRLAA